MSWASDIDAPGAKTRLTTSSQDADGVVKQLPATLLDAARRIGGAMTLDEYTLARIIASEMGSGSPEELLCVGDCDLERARRKGRSVFEHATGGTGRYGSQKAPRPVATSRDPYVRQLRAVRILLGAGGARGIARGGTQYYDPKTQLALWRDGRASHPLVILDRWTYARPWKTRGRDAEGRMVDTLGDPGELADQLEWCGPIDGVNAWELMLFRRRTTASYQASAYEDARALIESHGANQPSAPEDDARNNRLTIAALSLGVALVTGIG